ncbi:MAG: FGGY-family carbohydrate kinase [Pseudomonadota bacterium]
MSHVAVIDIGKTNVKLVLVDTATMSEIAVMTRPNTVLPGLPWPHFDVEGHWAFLLDGLAAFHRDHGISAITATTHGASGVLLDATGGLAAPVLDYEFDGPDEVAEAYDAIRPPFEETGSPRLSGGMNVGAQLFWMFETDPGLKDRVETFLTYPQYWGFQLTGVAASDVSSLGSHSDLWAPGAKTFSSLVKRLGLDGKMAPARPASDVLGPILPEIAERTGLLPDTPVHCGIHDSNASLLPHVLMREAPFSVVSTGTWVIAMSIGGAAVTLDPARDTLINVNALGEPVPSARFMGGRAFEMILSGQPASPDPAEIARVLDQRIMLLPSVVTESGPFQGRTGRWINGEPPIGSGERTAAASFYLALMTATGLDLIGHRGPVVVEGPFGGNMEFCLMLAAATGCPVTSAKSATGTSHGAALLTDMTLCGRIDGDETIVPDPPAAMQDYASAWKDATS